MTPTDKPTLSEGDMESRDLSPPVTAVTSGLHLITERAEALREEIWWDETFQIGATTFSERIRPDEMSWAGHRAARAGRQRLRRHVRRPRPNRIGVRGRLLGALRARAARGRAPSPHGRQSARRHRQGRGPLMSRYDIYDLNAKLGRCPPRLCSVCGDRAPWPWMSCNRWCCARVMSVRLKIIRAEAGRRP